MHVKISVEQICLMLCIPIPTACVRKYGKFFLCVSLFGLHHIIALVITL